MYEEVLVDRGFVGIFWVTSSKKGADIIFDRDEFDREELNHVVEYEVPHHVMWEQLAKEQFGGKYSVYDCNYFPRGQVVYDRDLRRTFVYVDKKIMDVIDTLDKLLCEIFLLQDYEYTQEEQYQSIMNFSDEFLFSIIRGKNTIGANLIEIYYGKTKILVELGKELGSKSELSEQEQLVISAKYDAVIISHYHADHAGLVEYKKNCPIYMGEGTKSVLNAIAQYNGKEMEDNFRTYTNRTPFVIGGIKITPYLCDHSAYDSHMLLFEGGGKSILYTGDFRFSGRKSKYRLLRDLPDRVETLICEGTNVGNHEVIADKKEEKDIVDVKSHKGIVDNKDIIPKTEQELEEMAAEIMENNKDKPVFILQSTTNIDRIVSFYKASTKTGRIFYMDNYQAVIAAAAGNKIPRPDAFRNVYAYTFKKISSYRYESLKTIKQKIRITQIGKDKSFTMLIRQSMLECIKKINDNTPLKDAVLIYSLWEGYKEDDSMKKFLEEILRLGIKIVSLHASGHAYPEDIEKLRRRVNPGEFVFVHTAK